MDLQQYNQALYRYKTKNDFDSAWALWQDLQRKGINGNAKTRKMLMDIAMSAGKLDETLAMASLINEIDGAKTWETPQTQEHKGRQSRPRRGPRLPVPESERPERVPGVPSIGLEPSPPPFKITLPLTVEPASGDESVKRADAMQVRHLAFEDGKCVKHSTASIAGRLITRMVRPEDLVLVDYTRSYSHTPSDIAKVLEGGVEVDGVIYSLLLSRPKNAPRMRQYWLHRGTPDDIVRFVLPRLVGKEALRDMPLRKVQKGMRLWLSVAKPAVPVRDSEVEIIDDICGDGGVLYTDGCGLVSSELAADLCKHEDDDATLPTALQIRYKGFKGSVVVDPRLQGRKLVLRRSMEKLPWRQSPWRPIPGGRGNEREQFDWAAIISSNTPYRKSLVIQAGAVEMLAALGVPESEFFRVEQERVNATLASLAVQRMPEGRADSVGASAFAVRDLDEDKRVMWLKQKPPAQGGVSIHGGVQAYGVPEPVRSLSDDPVLQPNQCFLRVRVNGVYRSLVGPVAVMMLPVLRPSDIRVFEAVDVPDGRYDHMLDTLVLPVKGDSAPALTGDYDGDRYTVIFDQRLIPTTMEECKYTALPTRRGPRLSAKTWLKSLVANGNENVLMDLEPAWLAYARSPKHGVRSAQCRALAELRQTLFGSEWLAGERERMSLLAKDKPKSKETANSLTARLATAASTAAEQMPDSATTRQMLYDQMRNCTVDNVIRFVTDPCLILTLTTTQVMECVRTWVNAHGQGDLAPFALPLLRHLDLVALPANEREELLALVPQIPPEVAARIEELKDPHKHRTALLSELYPATPRLPSQSS